MGWEFPGCSHKAPVQQRYLGVPCQPREVPAGLCALCAALGTSELSAGSGRAVRAVLAEQRDGALERRSLLARIPVSSPELRGKEEGWGLLELAVLSPRPDGCWGKLMSSSDTL